MSKINIPPIRGGFNLSKINDAFTAITNHLNNRVLYRNNVSGEANQVETDLDMNGKRIYNLPYPVDENEPVRKKDVMSGVSGDIIIDKITITVVNGIITGVTVDEP